MALLIRQLVLGMMALLYIAAFSAPLNAQNLQLQEQEIKAGLLYNFLKYTQWPPSDMTLETIVICLWESDPFKTYLQPLTGRSVNQRTIVIHSLRMPRDATECQLLFVSAGEKEHWPEMRKFLSGKSILTVSDFNHFATTGGMIEFGRKDDHINVEMNLEAVHRAQLHVENRLLRLVTLVDATSPEDGR